HHQAKLQGVGVAKCEYRISDFLFLSLYKVADEAHAGMAGHGSFLPALRTDFQAFKDLRAFHNFRFRPIARRLFLCRFEIIQGPDNYFAAGRGFRIEDLNAALEFVLLRFGPKENPTRWSSYGKIKGWVLVSCGLAGA